MKIKIENFLGSNGKKLLLLVTTVLFSRIIFAEKYFYDADVVGVALGSISYSLQETRPHLPGYFLHVKIISLLNYIIKDIHLCMMFLSIMYSVVGMVLTFVLLKKWLSERNAFIITLLLTFNPLVWFYGATPEVYSVDLFFSALFVILALNSRTIYSLPVIVAVWTGLRQTSGVLIMPLYLFLWMEKFREGEVVVPKFIISHAIGLLIGLAWFLPMIQTAGGLKEYLALYKTNSPLQNITTLQNVYQFSSYCFYVFIPIILIILPFLFKKGLIKTLFSDDIKKLTLLLAFWFLPAFLVFTFFNYSKGYFLISIIPLFAATGLLLEKKIFKEWIFWTVIILEILFFVFMPYKGASIENILSPEKRKQNLFETWKERTFSSYLMASSRINYQDETIFNLSLLLTESNSNNSPILLDPTIGLFARGLQVKFPSKTFMTLNYFSPDYYFDYHELNIQSRNGLNKKLENSYLITQIEFYDKYLQDISPYKVMKNNLVLLEITDQNRSKIISIYENLFVRKNPKLE